MTRGAVLRGAGFLVLVFLVALAGMWAGQRLGQSRAPVETELETDLVAGSPFPSEPLLAADRAPADTAELTRGGAIVLFMRFDCPACGMTVDHWRDEVESGSLSGVRVVGITTDPPEAIEPYRQAKSIPFPIYSDPNRAFVDQHGVSAVPFLVVVGPDGTIRESSVGFRPGLDLERLRDLATG